MDGPLSSAIYDTARPVPSFWEASGGPAPDREALAGEIRTEVAIIGGGYTGLTAARCLAERGIGAVVLDAGAIGWGSSGRNGGIVCYGGAKLSRTAQFARFGEAETRRSEALQAENIRGLRAFCLEAGLADWVQGETELVLAHGTRSAAKLAKETMPEGFTADPFAPSGRADIARFGGIAMSPGFGIHPLRLARALAEAAETAGAQLFPRSEVTLWERHGNGHRLVTEAGSVRADRVLLATNGFTPDGLHPAFRGRAVPVISNIAVTRTLTESERAEHPWLGMAPAADTRNLLAYFRLLPDHRLLFGIRGDMFGADSARERMLRKLRERLAVDLPGFAAAETAHFWRGPVCMTRRLTPSIGQLPDEPTVFHAFGWHGSGINMGTLAGRLIAGCLAGDTADTVPAPWRGLAPRLPLPGLRPLYVGAAQILYRLEDRQG